MGRKSMWDVFILEVTSVSLIRTETTEKEIRNVFFPHKTNTSLPKFLQNQLRQIKGFKASHLISCSEKNLHLNYSVQLPWDFPLECLWLFFSLILKKYNFITSVLLHLVVFLKKGTSFHKVETFRVVFGQPITQSKYLNSSYWTLNSEVNLQPYQLSISIIETRSLIALSERITCVPIHSV